MRPADGAPTVAADNPRLGGRQAHLRLAAGVRLGQPPSARWRGGRGGGPARTTTTVCAVAAVQRLQRLADDGPGPVSAGADASARRLADDGARPHEDHLLHTQRGQRCRVVQPAALLEHHVREATLPLDDDVWPDGR